MLYSRYSAPRKLEVSFETSKEIYNYLDDLCHYYKLGMTEVLESLICADHEEVSSRSRASKMVASSLYLD